MATATLTQLMDAIENRIKTAIPGLRVSSESPGIINPPAFIVGVPPVDDYRAAFGRGTVYLSGWPLTVQTSAKIDRVGQRALADYASWTGTKSIPLALEGDPTLGGLISDLKVASFRPLGLDEVGILGYFGGEFRMDLVLPGI